MATADTMTVMTMNENAAATTTMVLTSEYFVAEKASAASSNAVMELAGGIKSARRVRTV